MTHPKSTDLLPVTQADRDAAADLRMLLPPLAGSREIAAMRDGDVDDSAYVQAFARHRISHASVAREGVALLKWSEPHPSHSYPNWHAMVPEVHFEARIDTGKPLVYGKFPLSIGGSMVVKKFDTLEAAKAHAQVVFSDRILSCLALLPASPAQAVAPPGWRSIESAPMWQVAVVTNGEDVAISQKVESDFGGHYWAVDPEDTLEWEPTHWMPLPDAPAALTTPDGQRGER